MWFCGSGKSDVGKVAGHVARGDVESAIERDGEVRKIAAHPVAAMQHIPCGEFGTAREISILDIVMHPLADGRDTGQTVFHLAEFFPREVGQLVRLAISAGQRIAQQGGR